MKITVALLLGCATLAICSIEEYDTSLGWYVPKVDGTFDWVSKKDYEAETKRVSEISPRAYTVKFFLYTRANPSVFQQIYVGNTNSLLSSNYNPNAPTRIIIHGWNNYYNSDINHELRSAFLAVGTYNVFVVDWSSAAFLLYNSARAAVPEIGRTVASFIDFLNEKGSMSFSNLLVTGHSLGAHVSGYAGKNVRRGKINKIVGLDPALPLFSYNDCTTRLCPSDAGYVESIQTNGGLLGFLDPIGKASFYPNGGKTQPGCGSDVTGACAHGRSFQYFAEAIRRNSFPTTKCSTYQDAVGNLCGTVFSSVRMGTQSSYGISGYYYTPVKSSSPYGMAA